MPNVTLAFCPITVDDVDAAIPFYRDGLGLEIVNDVAYDGHRWVSSRGPRTVGPRRRPLRSRRGPLAR